VNKFSSITHNQLLETSSEYYLQNTDNWERVRVLLSMQAARGRWLNPPGLSDKNIKVLGWIIKIPIPKCQHWKLVSFKDSIIVYLLPNANSPFAFLSKVN